MLEFPYLREKFAGLEFQVRPDTFFQIYTETAEALLQVIQSELNLQGHEMLVDAYCGIGTLTLPLAKQVQQAIGIEIQPAAVQQAIFNAQHNGIENVTFQVGAVEKFCKIWALYQMWYYLIRREKGAIMLLLKLYCKRNHLG